MTKTITNAIEGAIDDEKWVVARRLIEQELKTSPKDHWLLTALALTYYEQKDYKKAITISKKALASDPDCPLVLWDYAGALDMVGRHDEAREIWHGLMKRGVNSIAFAGCNEGVGWAKAILNDCQYRIGISYARQGKSAYALRWINRHLDDRRPGIQSAYSVTEVRRSLAQIEAATTQRRLLH